MANRRATFTQSDVTKLLKAWRDAGFSAPTIVIEPDRITARPTEAKAEPNANPWDAI